MRRLAVSMILAVVAVLTLSAGNKKTQAQIKFAETTYNFGNIKEDGGPVTVEFKFTNVGTAPLTITSAKAECGCTKPSYPKEEIAPGKTGVIKVTYNPLGRPGGFTKVVTVRCTGAPGKVNLKIRGTVIPKDAYSVGNLYITPKSVNFGEMPKGVRRRQFVSLYNLGSSPMRPSFRSDSDALTWTLQPEEIEPGKSSTLTLYLDSSALPWLGFKELKLSGKCDELALEINVNATLMPKIN